VLADIRWEQASKVRQFEAQRRFAEQAAIAPKANIAWVKRKVIISLTLSGWTRSSLQKSRGKQRPTVLVVDDDPSVLRALARLIRAAGFEARTFGRPGLLLAAEIPKTNACLVLDVNLPEMSGLELYEALVISGRALPAIMITGQSDSKTRRLLKQISCVEVLFKPFDGDYLLNAIERAISSSLSAG
jgi:CheY-like chemotaxis protein